MFIVFGFWIKCRNINGKLRGLSLSIIPSVIFLFSGIVIANIPLIAFAVMFGINHILLSYKKFDLNYYHSTRSHSLPKEGNRSPYKIPMHNINYLYNKNYVL